MNPKQNASFDGLTSTECTLQQPSHKPYDYVKTEHDKSDGVRTENQRVEAYEVYK